MSDAIRTIQATLIDLGYDPGPVDGDYGPRTAQAVDLWQRMNGKPFVKVAAPVLAPAPPAAPATPGAPMLYQGSKLYPVDEVVIHCSATVPAWLTGTPVAAKRAEIKLWHTRDRKWKDIGYHWLIDRDGTYCAGRLETVIGAGVEGHNAGVIHVCLIGGHGSAANDLFQRHFTTAQAAGLLDRLRAIQSRTQIRRISGHNEWAEKACPGFNVPSWLKANPL